MEAMRHVRFSGFSVKTITRDEHVLFSGFYVSKFHNQHVHVLLLWLLCFKIRLVRLYRFSLWLKMRRDWAMVCLSGSNNDDEGDMFWSLVSLS